MKNKFLCAIAILCALIFISCSNDGKAITKTEALNLFFEANSATFSQDGPGSDSDNVIVRINYGDDAENPDRSTLKILQYTGIDGWGEDFTISGSIISTKIAAETEGSAHYNITFNYNGNHLIFSADQIIVSTEEEDSAEPIIEMRNAKLAVNGAEFEVSKEEYDTAERAYLEKIMPLIEERMRAKTEYKNARYLLTWANGPMSESNKEEYVTVDTPATGKKVTTIKAFQGKDEDGGDYTISAKLTEETQDDNTTKAIDDITLNNVHIVRTYVFKMDAEENQIQVGVCTLKIDDTEFKFGPKDFEFDHDGN